MRGSSEPNRLPSGRAGSRATGETRGGGATRRRQETLPTGSNKETDSEVSRMGGFWVDGVTDKGKEGEGNGGLDVTAVFSLRQEAPGAGAGGPERRAGCTGREGEGDGQHQPTGGAQELHRPECHRGGRERRLL